MIFLTDAGWAAALFLAVFLVKFHLHIFYWYIFWEIVIFFLTSIECMDNHHTCPNCKAYLGRYRHFWRKLLSRIFSVQLSRSRALFFYVTLKSHHPSQLTQESWYLFNNIMFFKTNIHSRLSCGQMYWTGSTHNWRIIFLHRIILVYDTLIAFLRWYIDKCNRGKIPFTSFEFRVLHFGISLGCWRAICVW